MRVGAIIIVMVWPLSLSAYDKPSEPEILPLIPDEIMGTICAEISSGYWLESMVNLFTCSKSMYRFLTDPGKSALWRVLAVYNYGQNGYDDYIFKKFTQSLLKYQFTLSRILMGYGGILIENYPTLIHDAQQRGDTAVAAWLSSACGSCEKNNDAD